MSNGPSDGRAAAKRPRARGRGRGRAAGPTRGELLPRVLLGEVPDPVRAERPAPTAPARELWHSSGGGAAAVDAATSARPRYRHDVRWTALRSARDGGLAFVHRGGGRSVRARRRSRQRLRGLPPRRSPEREAATVPLGDKLRLIDALVRRGARPHRGRRASSRRSGSRSSPTPTPSGAALQPTAGGDVQRALPEPHGLERAKAAEIGRSPCS